MSDIIVVCGLGFGDEGKGTITDFLTRERDASIVSRYNGGPQAGHNVITPEGTWHCFAQFGAGMFVPGVETYLSKDMLIDLESLAIEAGILSQKGIVDACSRLIIDKQCTLITPMHKMVGRIREITRKNNAHGSCGMGVGQAIEWREHHWNITVNDVITGRAQQLLKQLVEYAVCQARMIVTEDYSDEAYETWCYFRERCDASELFSRYRFLLSSLGIRIDDNNTYLSEMLSRNKTIIFEGAQGALLDRRQGFYPHVTKSRTTWENARDLIEHADVNAFGRIKKIGILRAYSHRHGAGPFVTEDAALKQFLDDPLNFENRWQGAFRVGSLDLLMLRYGIAINSGVDEIALTSLDRLSGLDPIRVCVSYEYRGDFTELDQYFEWEPLGEGRARITALCYFPYPRCSGLGLADHLFQCKPLDWVELPGWQQDIGTVRNIYDLPEQARAFLEFLESPQGVSTPISLVSVGPTSDQKIRTRVKL